MTPLEGIRVLDLSRTAPGPYCTLLLSDMGADVVVIEPPSRGGKDARPSDPLTAEQGDRLRAHDPLWRNKRSLGLDLKSEEGKAIFLGMAERADVVLEGFRPGVVERLGIDYARLSALNPALVYCSLTGYGQTGPYAQRAGHDLDYVAIAGALGTIGRPGTAPAIPLNLLADFAGGGLMAAYAIVVALFARQRGGLGQHIDLAMTDGVVSLLSAASARAFALGAVPRAGADRINGALPYYDVYACKDGKFLAVAPLEPAFFERLCKELDRPELVPLQAQPERWAELRAAFTRCFAERTRDDWFARLGHTDACVAPVYALDEALADPAVRARGMVVEVDDPRHGRVSQIGIAPKLSRTPGRVRSASATPRQHTAEVLEELGYDATAIARLRSAGAVG